MPETLPLPTDSSQPKSLDAPWHESIDLSTLAPGEPMVSCPVRHADPYAVIEAPPTQFHSVRVFHAECARSLLGEFDEGVENLRDSATVLLEQGTHAVEELWSRTLRTSVPRRLHFNWMSGGRNGSWTAPSIVGLSPEQALLFLVVIGRIDRPIPLSIARGLLNSHAPWWEDRPTIVPDIRAIRDQSSLRVTRPSGIALDESHRLVAAGSVLGEGWRSRSVPVFRAHEVPVPWGCERETHAAPSAPAFAGRLDHDGHRIVAITPGARHPQLSDRMQVVEIAELLPEVQRILGLARADAVLGNDPRSDDAPWRAAGDGGSAVAKRIVEELLQEYAPWPYPFRARNAAETSLPQSAVRSEVVRLFDRVRAAPVCSEPPSTAAHFMSLIEQGRAPLTTWPEQMAGVWGFKIRTGDHSWLNGTIWMEPGVADAIEEPLQFIPASLFRSTGEYIRAGSLRCVLKTTH